MGTLSSMSAVDLGVLSVKELLNRAGIEPGSGVVDEVVFGQVLQAGAGQNPARQVALGAGLPVSTPCVTVNKVCGSSLKAAMMAANSIRAGEYKAIIAGGMESMSNAPQLLMGQRKGAKMGNSTLVDSMIHDGLWDVYNDVHMGTTGETVAKECNIDRQTMDALLREVNNERPRPGKTDGLTGRPLRWRFLNAEANPLFWPTTKACAVRPPPNPLLVSVRCLTKTGPSLLATPAPSTMEPAPSSSPMQNLPSPKDGISSPPSKITALRV